MRHGDIINGYRILKDFTCAGGGLSKWTFAEKHGREYFIKEFLFPTYPLASSPGSQKVKERKWRDCEEFEARHGSLMEAINSRPIPGGNLIATLDFFREGAKYYKVTEKVDVTTLKPVQIAKLDLQKKALIMTTVAHSLRILHGLSIVHGDLKLDNVLIKQTRMGSYAAKLIDFDDSYFSGKPSAIAEEVVGDMVFYSPELARYIQQNKDAKPEHLTEKSDIFALGLLYSLYLTGRLPKYDMKKYQYACLAVNNGETLMMEPGEIPETLVDMINTMLDPDPDLRPDVDTIFAATKSSLKPPKAPPVPRKKSASVKNAPPSPPKSLNLKGKMTDEARPEEKPKKKAPVEKSPGSSLKGTLLSKGGKK